jgi:hypothetical protein
MHQLSAAGTTLEAEVCEDGTTRIVAHVVDPIAVAKVRNQVYRGFSIGGRVTRREAGNPITVIWPKRMRSNASSSSPDWQETRARPPPQGRARLMMKQWSRKVSVRTSSLPGKRKSAQKAHPPPKISTRHHGLL